MVDIPIACSSSMGASSTGGILGCGCLSLSCGLVLANYAAWLPFRRCLLWAGTRLRCVAASHRRFGRRGPTAKSFCALITSGPAPAAPAAATGGEKQIPQAWGGLGRAPRSPRGGFLFPSPAPNAAAERRRRGRHSTSLAVLLVAHGATGSRQDAAEASRAAFSVRGASS